ncbi:diacylglycerol kinase family lipid kinase [Hoyosella rhizosphaerae]|uniref:DAGKc domain-containing protein n=1 Tax=Hoyosella rhizosphaerae TaxID=1755582 RepID=A0A916UBJ1_9ACTN|nr:diacylglycerol kinase family protein [Hoyosella rhizosphaerae]MBN4925977.1 diacylglycerol kinase family lipid kinase [Hoyosella rhizosphaerae]GGC66514.1 hypothetical protein GCM10011410_18880 [Hoyosella rhizosphaerae]
MRAMLIVNPHATSTTPSGRDLIGHALSSTLSVRLEHTQYRGHAAELAAEATAQGFPLIIVHGGDGTVNEVVNGILGAPQEGLLRSLPVGAVPTLAVIPGGSANVFARSLGIEAEPLDAVNQLIDLVRRRQHRRIGLAHCDGRWFLFNAGVGLDAHVVKAVEKGRARGKTASPGRYIRSTIRTFMRERKLEPALTVTVPSGQTFSDVYFAFISNASPWTYIDERPVVTNPGVDYNSGLGIFAMQSARWIATLRVARQIVFAKDGPRHKKLVRVDDVPTVTVSASRPTGLQVDGDYIGMRQTVTFHAVSDMIDVMAPPE